MEPRRIYVDLEYCYPSMTRESGRPSDSDLRQIVQIAAIKIDPKTGKELEALDLLVHPAFEKRLPTFFTDLTGISQKMLHKRAVTFPEALKEFEKFCGSAHVWTFNNDWSVFKQNCGYFNILFVLAPFTKVRDILPDWGIDPQEYSSGTLHKAAGIVMRGHVHNALHDVRSMAAAVHFFETSN